MASKLVIVDTCMWVTFFKRSQSPAKLAIVRLLKRNRVALIGPIVHEILSGFRRDAEADWIASKLSGIGLIPLSFDDWLASARLSRQLASHGQRIPQTDLAIAAAALRHGHEVYSTDPHFDLFPQLVRFSPDASH
jgi:predicted nucleic acid-binding protein